MYAPGGEKPAVGMVRAYGSPIMKDVENVMVIPWFIYEGTLSNRQHVMFPGSIPGRAMSVQHACLAWISLRCTGKIFLSMSTNGNSASTSSTVSHCF